MVALWQGQAGTDFQVRLLMDPLVPSPLELLHAEAQKESLEAFRSHMVQAMLFPKKDRLRRWSIRRALGNEVEAGLFAEFGVAKGGGTRLFANFLKDHGETITGFDSFEGLEEDWTGHHAGRGPGFFSTGGELPDVPRNATLVKGWVQDTLPGWLKANKGPFAFVHMDMDTYSPTAFALKAIKPRLVEGTVILFDELYGYPGWRFHEWKALEETLDSKTYRFIGFSHESVAIEMTGAP